MSVRPAVARGTVWRRVPEAGTDPVVLAKGSTQMGLQVRSLRCLEEGGLSLFDISSFRFSVVFMLGVTVGTVTERACYAG